MDNRLHASFYTNKHGGQSDKCSIYLRITISGIREAVSTGITISKNQWDAAKSRIKGNSEEAYSKNNLLNALYTKATEAYTECVKRGFPLTARQIKNMLTTPETDCETLMGLMKNHNVYVMRKVGIEVTKATLKKYQTLMQKVQDFMKKELQKNDIPLDKIKNGFVIAFELYLKADEKIGHNTAIKYIQALKTVINYGIGMDLLHHDPFKAFKCTIQPILRECLTQDELDTLANKQITIARLAVVRDVFVFSCYTGLAYVDVQKLKYSEIVKGMDGKQWIQTYRAKTQTRVPVPLLPKALALIEQYRSADGTAEKHVFPVASNQKVNAYLKELADMCGITKRLTFHIARHTFATTITLSNGVPIETVSKLLGHTNIKTTQIYSKVVDSKISNDMANLRLKLDGNQADENTA